ncbi:P2Y purinoceptor 13-like isoform X5 [Brachyhypopomus gauderio]|uniref:P2Y purinoceptor 13-like isoform X5 n=1 Tax=Brachyhypopomus gauderio TaxID=698409 RepID=UPI004041F177
MRSEQPLSLDRVIVEDLALNAVTVRVYFCTSQRFRSSVTVYLKNLAAADFFLCLCLPIRIANYASGSHAMQNVYCSFGTGAFYLNMYASILFMEYIAANRYLKIVHPLGNNFLQTTRAARYVSLITWTSLSGAAFVYVVLFLSTSWNAVRSRPDLGCDSLHAPAVSLFYKVIHSVSAVIFSAVLASLVLLYWATVRGLQRTMQPLQAKVSKSRRNMLVLVGVFCVCFVPYHLVRLPYAFLKTRMEQHCSTRAFYVVKELTVLLSVLNACLDPLIYFFFCKTFRARLNINRGQRKGDGRPRRQSNTVGYTETRISGSTLQRESSF